VEGCPLSPAVIADAERLVPSGCKVHRVFLPLNRWLEDF